MFDACIIGAGIVGCAIARELAQRGLSVIVIEKHETACEETSGLNSRVIHSGFHETAGTQKAQLALAGSKQIIEYAESRGIPFLRTGMLIAVPYGSVRAGLWREAGALWNLWRQGRRHHIPFRFLTTPRRVLEIAPVRALGGIFIPTVVVIGLEVLAQKLIEDARASAAQFVFGNEVRGITVAKTNHVVETEAATFEARALINAAGLGASAISAMAAGPRYDIEFIRGDYYELEGGVARWNIRTLVYPAMPPRSRSKGIHFGPRTDGRLYLGPSATPISEKPSKELFLAAARKFLPDIRDEDLHWAYSGIRPKLVTAGAADFVIRLDRSSPPLINLVGIDSPGLSASMAIAAYVAEIVLKQW